MSNYLSRELVHERLGISPDTVDRLIQRGEIKAVKIGRCVRIEQESIDHYLRMHVMKQVQNEA